MRPSTSGRPHEALIEKKISKAGRNNHGRVTVRHQGGGHKQHYRVIDFRRNKDGIVAKVERIEYDPNRSANIALLCYADGERRYIVAPRGLDVGAQVISGAEAPIRPATRSRFATSRSAARFTVSKFPLARVPSWRVRRVLRCSCCSRR